MLIVLDDLTPDMEAIKKLKPVAVELFMIVNIIRLNVMDSFIMNSINSIKSFI